MRDVWKGALGALLAYPLVWYFSAPNPAAPGLAPVAPASESLAQKQRPQNEELMFEPGSAGRQTFAQRSPIERALPERQPAVAPVVAPDLPRVPGVEPPRVTEPEVPMPSMAELKETFARMAELQDQAHNPAELDRRVQTMEQDPEKLARLRQLAEMFVKLPESRSEPYLPSDAEGTRPTGAR